MSKAGAQTYSISELSRLTTLDRDTVRKRLLEVPSTPGAKGAVTYALEAALPALIGGADAELDEARRRKMRAEAELKELELAGERGEYVSAKEVESARVKEYQWLYHRLTSQLPRAAAETLYRAESPDQVAEVLRHELGRVLNDWLEL